MTPVLWIGRGLSVLFWLLAAAALAGLLPPLLNRYVPLLGGLIFIVHILECGFYLLRLRRPEDRVVLALVQTLAFGMFYLSPRLKGASGQ